MAEELKEGWGFPSNSKKAHFFQNDSRSLCGVWAFWGHLENDNHDSPDNCNTCRVKRLKKLGLKDELPEKVIAAVLAESWTKAETVAQRFGLSVPAVRKIVAGNDRIKEESVPLWGKTVYRFIVENPTKEK